MSGSLGYMSLRRPCSNSQQDHTVSVLNFAIDTIRAELICLADAFHLQKWDAVIMKQTLTISFGRATHFILAQGGPDDKMYLSVILRAIKV